MIIHLLGDKTKIEQLAGADAFPEIKIDGTSYSTSGAEIIVGNFNR